MKKIVPMVVLVLVLSLAFGMAVPVAQAADGHLVAVDQPFRCAHIEQDIDSVAYNQELSGQYNWNFHIQNNNDQMIDSPTISVNSTLDPGFFPNVDEFPASWSLPSLDPWEKWYLHALSSTVPVTFTLGYDCSRTMAPLEIPPGGGEQTVTVKVRPVDERYTSNPFMKIFVGGSVIDGSNSQPGGAVPTINPDGIVWEFRDWELETEYTFSVELQVENPSDVDLLHKPHINMFVESAEFLAEETGTSTTIYDEILGGEITYSVATAGDWQWLRIRADCWMVEYKPLSQPLLEYEPMTGQKLVGYGFYGTHDLGELDGATYHLHTMFTFTNPDGVSEITIERVSIFDRYGTVLYEGPLKPGTEERIMMPH